MIAKSGLIPVPSPNPGEYIMVPAGADEAIYQDCSNIALFKKSSGNGTAKEKVGVYCWLGGPACSPCPSPLQIEVNPANINHEDNITTKRKAIVVELSATKTTIYPGEMLKFHVSIRNQGLSPLYIPKDISEVNQRFVLSVHFGSNSEGSGTMAVGDKGIFAPGHVPPFANLLSMDWIVLDPGTFYGRDIDVYANDLPRLRIPGRYTITGRYASHGFRENLRGFEEDTGKLPFKAWEGEVETNPVKIVVTKAAK